MSVMLGQIDRTASIKKEKTELEDFFQEEQAANASCVAELQAKISESQQRALESGAQVAELRLLVVEMERQVKAATVSKEELEAAVQQLKTDAQASSARLQEVLLTLFLFYVLQSLVWFVKLEAALQSEKQIKAAAQRDLVESEEHNVKLSQACKEQATQIIFLTESLKEVEGKFCMLSH